MSKARQLLTVAWLAMASHALADNFIVADFSIAQGETKTVSVELNNPENEYIAFEFDMTLPEGLTILEDEDGYLLTELNSNRGTANHELMASRMADGSYHFVCYSFPNTKLRGTSGEILTMTVCAAEDATPATGLEGKMLNQKLSDPQKNPVTFDDFTFQIDITEPASEEGCCPHGCKMGDLNFDGSLTVTDVVLLVNEILGGGEHIGCPKGCLLGDMNGDGTVTVTDVVVLVNLILGP